MRNGLLGEKSRHAMVSVSLSRGQQREHDIVSLAMEQCGEEVDQVRAVPVGGAGGRGVGGESQVLLIEDVVMTALEQSRRVTSARRICSPLT